MTGEPGRVESGLKHDRTDITVEEDGDGSYVIRDAAGELTGPFPKPVDADLTAAEMAETRGQSVTYSNGRIASF